MMSFLIQNKDVCLLKTSSVTLGRFLKFSTCKFCTFLIRFISKYFIFFLLLWVKSSLSLYLLTTSVCKGSHYYFLILILHSSTWLNFLIVCVSFSIKPSGFFSDIKLYHLQGDILKKKKSFLVLNPLIVFFFLAAKSGIFNATLKRSRDRSILVLLLILASRTLVFFH